MVKRAASYIMAPGKLELAFRLSIILASIFGIAFSICRVLPGLRIGMNQYLVAGAAAFAGFAYLRATGPPYKISRPLKYAMALIAVLSLAILLVV